MLIKVCGTGFRLVDWCLDYSKIQEDEINPKAHRVFYSGCQVHFIILNLEILFKKQKFLILL